MLTSLKPDSSWCIFLNIYSVHHSLKAFWCYLVNGPTVPWMMPLLVATGSTEEAHTKRKEENGIACLRQLAQCCGQGTCLLVRDYREAPRCNAQSTRGRVKCFPCHALWPGHSACSSCLLSFSITSSLQSLPVHFLVAVWITCTVPPTQIMKLQEYRVQWWLVTSGLSGSKSFWKAGSSIVSVRDALLVCLEGLCLLWQTKHAKMSDLPRPGCLKPLHTNWAWAGVM